ncbi:hypothetical protein [Bradyrhizobium monzae]|uniref:hypothetical protein n=1 Tax=Bradyrhizobium sp. Oc8 TaxID=2876780 RepID=UPI001F3133A8|nr:hypothetical protein [Bradyrhizobium sp. Oc8]
MFFNASRVLTLAAAAFAVTGTATAQTHAPQRTIDAAAPEVVPSLSVRHSKGAALQSGQPARTVVSPNAIVFPGSCKSGFVCRQDLFDRNNGNNLRSDWPAPPAQPGQF